MPIPFWAGRYIGLPFREHGRDRKGLDCWGLVRLIMGEQFGFAVPSYVGEYQRTTEAVKIGALIERETRGWMPVAVGDEVCGDIVVLRVRGKPMHVGLVLGDSHMLHIERGIDSVIERYNGPNWESRVFGFFRHKPSWDRDDDTDE